MTKTPKINDRHTKITNNASATIRMLLYPDKERSQQRHRGRQDSKQQHDTDNLLLAHGTFGKDQSREGDWGTLVCSRFEHSVAPQFDRPGLDLSSFI
jgi:hypothetical protein